MIIIGEKINSTLKAVRPAIENYDIGFIQELAKKQFEAGANFIDVNAGMFHDDEPKRLKWLVETVQEVIGTPFAIDSPNPEAIEEALKVNKNGKPIINSITDEKERYEAILPLILEYNTGVIALCMDDSGMPETVDDRLEVAVRIIGKLTDKGVKPQDIYIDPMIRPIGTGSHYGVVALETIRQVKDKYSDVHIACGLSNISFGLPGRKVLNQAFLIAAMTVGMDGAILDPLDKKLMTYLYATQALLGQDEFCMDYLSKYREGLLDL
ncbi:MAG TPA: methyltetrahydrofolate cobalamin methyltransferase [Clostridiales bacterium]|nr:methyltetrahydrofolate cobalamin methyltransferase [Clostridiales bacterium]